MASIEELTFETEEKMMDAVTALDRDFAGFRTGKASPALVENLMVDYYGAMTRLRDMAGISTPEPRMLVVQPWDQNALANIEKAIHSAAIGITPQNDGRVIRLPVPELSEERRRDLIKEVKKRSEQAKVEIRNHRRDANDEARKAQKNSEITEDDLAGMLDEIQNLTNQYTDQVTEKTEVKETELLTV